MKLLLIGATESWSLEMYYLKYFKEISDLQVDVLSTSDFAKKFFRNPLDRILNRLFPNKNPYFDKLNRHLLEYIKYNSPDIILIFKGMEIYPESLLKIRSWGIPIANYNPDHPFIIYSRGSGNENVKKSAAFYDLHFCYSRDLVNQIEKELNIPSVHLPFGYELTENDYGRIVEQDIETLKVCFIGNPDSKRVDIIKSLLEDNFEVDVYGYNWDKYLNQDSNSGLRIFDAVFDLDFWATARRYRIQLNVFRPHNIGSHNMRTFEIPAVGGIMLAPKSPEHIEFYNEGREVFFYESMEDLKTKAKYLLNLPHEDAQKIRDNARIASLNQRYDYKSRSQTIINTLKTTLIKQVCTP